MLYKVGKEKSIKNNDEFRIKYGTVNSVDFKSMYLSIKSWVTPNMECDYEKFIKLSRRSIILKLNELLKNNPLFRQQNIVDLDLRSSGMSLDKKSFMTLEITLFTKHGVIDFKSKEIRQLVNDLSFELIKLLKNKELTYSANK